MRHAPLRPTPGHALRAAALVIAVGYAAAFGAVQSASAQRLPSGPEVTLDQLMKPTELADIAIGSPDAKVTIVEYSSLTCPHCATFANDIFPGLKAKYIDTGKVRFITRDFPLNNLAAAASMLVRCGDKDKAFALVDTMFATQKDWAFTEGNPVPKLFDLAKDAGFTKESFDACLKDQALLDKVLAARKYADETLHVNSTPSFFVNGKRVVSVGSVDDLAKVVDPLLDPQKADAGATPVAAPDGK